MWIIYRFFWNPSLSCYVINKALGVVGQCLLWQKSESDWDTVNFITTLSQLSTFFKCVKRQGPLFCQLKNNYKIWPTSVSDKELKKSRTREKYNLSTNANRSTNTEKNIQALFAKKHFKKKLTGGNPRSGRNTFSKQNNKSLLNYGLVSGKTRNIQDFF